MDRTRGNKMKVLYILAHPEPKSFNAAMKNTALTALKEKGHEAKLSDLYAMEFDPILKASDFPERKKTRIFLTHSSKLSKPQKQGLFHRILKKKWKK